jgi:hypothetical protein
MEIDTEPNADINPIQNPKKTRCPTGMRKDRKTGLCIPMTEELIQHKKTLRNKAKSNKVSLKKNSREEELDVIPVIEPSVLEEESSPPSSPSVEQPIVKRCPTGFRKDPKTKKCVPMSEKLIQHKKTLRNKRKLTVVPVDEEPVNDQPTDTQPAVEESAVVEETAEIVEEPAIEEPAVVEEPAVEEEPVVVLRAADPQPA